MMTLEIEAGCGVRVDGETGEKRVGEKNIGGVDQGWDGIKEAMPSPGSDEGK